MPSYPFSPNCYPNGWEKQAYAGRVVGIGGYLSPTLNRPLPNRPGLRGGSFLFLGLALFVFVWGLQYKVSLYDPPQSQSRTIPAAKLLSENEWASVTGNVLVNLADPGAQPVMHFLLGPLCLLCMLALSAYTVCARSLGSRPPHGQSLPSFRAGLTAFFFRPPPVLA